MKSREEFIGDVFEKAEAVREKEALRRRKWRKITGAAAAAAACVMLVAGAGGWMDDIAAENHNPAIEPVQEFRSEPVFDESAGGVADTAQTSEKKSKKPKKNSEPAVIYEIGDGEAISLPDKGITHSVADDAYIYGSKKMENLSIEIFKQAANSKQNSMISPISVITAMAMVESGADGETKDQMEKAFGMPANEMREWIKEWSQAQKSKSADGKTKINIANAFWYNRAAGFEPDSDYKKLLKKSFNAEIKGGNFDNATVNQINKWVDKQTDGMIKKLVEQLNPNNMTVLANAVAFQDKWEKPYEKSQVKKENFTLENGQTKKMNMMYSTESTYLSDKLATGFTKSYESGYKFVAILPNEGISVEEYLVQMSGENFADFLHSGEDAIVHAIMPSFKSEYSTDAMVGILRNMGIKDVFSPADADLKKMGTAGDENLFVSDIIHKTFIEVDRKGTKAAAVTGVFVKTTSFMPAPLNAYTVRLDRPYLYAIIDENTQIPVFMGTMMGK